MLLFCFKAFGIFLAAVFGDVVWALYVKKISEHKQLSASVYAVLIGIFFLVNVEIIINNLIYGIFYLIGLFIGTYYHQQIENFGMECWIYVKESLAILKK